MQPGRRSEIRDLSAQSTLELFTGLNIPWSNYRTCTQTHTNTYTARACQPLGTCATGTAGICAACTSPSRSGRCSCRRTGRFWWRCVGRSPCSPRSSARCSGSRRPCRRTRCTPRCQASWGRDPSFSSPAGRLHAQTKRATMRGSCQGFTLCCWVKCVRRKTPTPQCGTIVVLRALG